ncbi:nucleoside-diphosphate-sugar pyrophosphorylase [Streptomyces sp. ME02-6977A]|nr:nucleoside-diphosphate-sugar pyrophosphorylase [Streptomyces coelicolor]MDX2930626.1 nucleoside-diphosphate-sugar pyrophosphorylase [Streptomyces sp. NRRL_B-16638]MDX3406354.1 nucleoside-diphosphate-sugar pyrophosphorylase [Streptomyces sp. ME02-6977A]MDX3426749.1 nucleoside-diphosphate-sugar pyrophosphorylase [Streptomyces sp. ME02-6985-2c]
MHPTARIHPTAIVNDDVIIGSGVKVWEFTIVRGHTHLTPGVSIGFNCEITNSCLGAGAWAIASASTAPSWASTSTPPPKSWQQRSPDMTRPATTRFSDCPTASAPAAPSRFGGLVGDRVQTGGERPAHSRSTGRG